MISKEKYFILVILLLISQSFQDVAKITPHHHFSVEIKDDNTLTFAIVNMDQQPGWVGVGFGGHLMEKTDYHIFTFKTGKKTTALDSWSDEHVRPMEDVSWGGKYDLVNGQEHIVKGNTVYFYERKIDTGDKWDHKFVNGDNKMVVSWWDDADEMTKHGSQVMTGNININFDSKKVSITPTRYVWFELHGIGMLIIWCILNSIGYVTGRFLKHITYFRFIHIATSGTCGIINLVFGIFGLINGKILNLFYII